MKLELSELDQEVKNIVEEQAKGLVKSCAKNAIRHLEKAWDIKDIDPEMSIFRAITAEEEAATSIFIALKEKGYENASKIKLKNHTYNNGISPFFLAISQFMADASRFQWFPFKHYNLIVKSSEVPKKLELSFVLLNDVGAMPIPPLNFSIKKNNKLYHFENELNEITSGESRDQFIKHIKQLANLRNCLIYANHEGIPTVNSEIEGHLRLRKKIVFNFLRVLCLIFPYSQKASFVQQALNAYLKMLGDIQENIEKGNA
jgi:hypothetical protein